MVVGCILLIVSQDWSQVTVNVDNTNSPITVRLKERKITATVPTRAEEMVDALRKGLPFVMTNKTVEMVNNEYLQLWQQGMCQVWYYHKDRSRYCHSFRDI